MSLTVEFFSVGSHDFPLRPDVWVITAALIADARPDQNDPQTHWAIIDITS